MVEIFLCITGKHIRKQDIKGKAKDWPDAIGILLSKGADLWSEVYDIMILLCKLYGNDISIDVLRKLNEYRKEHE